MSWILGLLSLPLAFSHYYWMLAFAASRISFLPRFSLVKPSFLLALRNQWKPCLFITRLPLFNLDLDFVSFGTLTQDIFVSL